MPRHSQLQLQVLTLYKQFLRATQGKPGFVHHIRREFKKNATISRTDTMKIEYVYRQGRRKLEMFQNSSVTGMGVFEPDEEDQ